MEAHNFMIVWKLSQKHQCCVFLHRCAVMLWSLAAVPTSPVPTGPVLVPTHCLLIQTITCLKLLIACVEKNQEKSLVSGSVCFPVVTVTCWQWRSVSTQGGWQNGTLSVISVIAARLRRPPLACQQPHSADLTLLLWTSGASAGFLKFRSSNRLSSNLVKRQNHWNNVWNKRRHL